MNQERRWRYWLGVGLSLLMTGAAIAQGTLYIDQGAGPDGGFSGYGPTIQSNSPIGQSFTPTLSSLDFVQMQFSDANQGNSLGATVYINLRADSITGTVMSATSPVSLPDNFGVFNQGVFPGVTNFFFSSSVSLTPGTIYYLEPVIQSGDLFGLGGYNSFNYAGGVGYVNGVPNRPSDFWFREGIIVPAPEPGTLALGAVGFGALCYGMRRFRRS